MSFEQKLNPICVLSYLFFVIFITMFSTNPILLGISFVSSIILYLSLAGVKKTLSKIGYSLIFIVIVAMLNPLFSKQGMTELFEVGTFVFTLEAFVYGIAVGVMFASVIIWFGVLNILLDSDKITYIFGKFAPKIGTILSVSLGLFPKYVAQYKKIDNNLKGLGLYDRTSFFGKIRLKMHAMSTLVTWSIEGSLTLSDSMSARGYDLKGKRFFGKFKFGVFDWIFLIFSVSVGVCLLVFMGLGVTEYYYYPTFKQLVFDSSLCLYLATFIFMNVMLMVNVWRLAKWQFSISKI